MLVSKWITDEHFDKAIPNAPKITSGKVRKRVLRNPMPWIQRTNQCAFRYAASATREGLSQQTTRRQRGSRCRGTTMARSLSSSAYHSLMTAGRLGAPQDIAHAVSFFVSRAAGFVIGQRLVVDGCRGLLCGQVFNRENRRACHVQLPSRGDQPNAGADRGVDDRP